MTEEQFHALAWSQPLLAVELYKEEPAGRVHMSATCTECSWIATFHLRGLISDGVG